MTNYTSKGEGFSSKTGKGAPMGGKFQVANEAKQARANRSTKVKVSGAPKQVAKTKRVVGKKNHNAGMAGSNRTVLRSDLRRAL